MEQKTIIIIAGDNSDIALSAAKEFYGIRKKDGVCPNIICMSGRKSLFSFKTQAEKVKQILLSFGISESRILVETAERFENCVLEAFKKTDISNAIWCLPAGMNILVKRLAFKQNIQLAPENFRDDWKNKLSKSRRSRKQEIRLFAKKLIAEKLVGPGDTILGRYLSTGIIWNDGRPTFKVAERPYGLQ